MSQIEELFRTYYRALCLYAVHYVEDIDIAEDIVMECFLKYTEKTGHGEKIVSPKSYLFQMVRNASLDDTGKGQRRIAIEHAADVAYQEDEWMERSEREARLWAEIDHLPTACRTVLLMSKRDGMKYVEIADRLGISVKTVEAHIYKAYTTLRGKAKAIYVMFFV